MLNVAFCEPCCALAGPCPACRPSSCTLRRATAASELLLLGACRRDNDHAANWDGVQHQARLLQGTAAGHAPHQAALCSDGPSPPALQQRDSNFFGASQYVAAMLVTQLPMSATESVIYSLIVYFIVGLYRSAG